MVLEKRGARNQATHGRCSGGLLARQYQLPQYCKRCCGCWTYTYVRQSVLSYRLFPWTKLTADFESETVGVFCEVRQQFLKVLFSSVSFFPCRSNVDRAVIRRPLTAEARVRSRTVSRDICVGGCREDTGSISDCFSWYLCWKMLQKHSFDLGMFLVTFVLEDTAKTWVRSRNVSHDIYYVKYRRGTGSISDCFMWHLCWNKARRASVCSEKFSFLLSVSFHESFILILIDLLLLPEGRTGDAWKLFNQIIVFYFWGARKTLDRKSY